MAFINFRRSGTPGSTHVKWSKVYCDEIRIGNLCGALGKHLQLHLHLIEVLENRKCVTVQKPEVGFGVFLNFSHPFSETASVTACEAH